MTNQPTQQGSAANGHRLATSQPPLSVNEALSLFMEHAHPVSDIEIVDTGHTLGRVLAKDQISSIDVPRHDNSAMDGYAIRSQDMVEHEISRLNVNQRISAGTVGKMLSSGCAARVFTGAPIPPGADAVVAQEECAIQGDQISIRQRVRPGENIRPRGNAITAGATILKRGIKIRPQEMALAASMGLATLPVYRRLRVAIFSTGNELVKLDSPLQDAQIYDSNRYALLGLLQEMGCEINDLGITADELSATRNTLREAANVGDLIITSGGVSVGEDDCVKQAVKDMGQLDVWRVAIKPGKPLAFGSVQGIPIVGLPGNPVATCVTFLVFVRPFLKRMQGIKDVANKMIQVPAGFGRTRATNRREYARARLCIDSGGTVTTKLYPKQGSDILTSMTWAHGLVEIPERQPIKPGQLVRFFPFSELVS